MVRALKTADLLAAVVVVWLTMLLSSNAKSFRSLADKQSNERKVLELPESELTPKAKPKEQMAPAPAPEPEPEFELGPTGEPVPPAATAYDPTWEYYVKRTSIDHFGAVS